MSSLDHESRFSFNGSLRSGRLVRRKESEQRGKGGRKTEATCQPPLHAGHPWRRCTNSGSCANARNLAKKQRLGRLESQVAGTSYVRSSKRRLRRPRIPSRSAPDPTGAFQAQPQATHLVAACPGIVPYVCLHHAFPSLDTTTNASLCRAESGSHWSFKAYCDLPHQVMPQDRDPG